MLLAFFLAAETFTLGSYGRISAATSLRGTPGYSLNVVGHGPRLEESSYQELDFRWRPVQGEHGQPLATIVSTLAAGENLFHYDGDFKATLALRNLYLEVAEAGVEGLTVWAGSRMYRGDDVYLLDWWPLDNLNTVGAGAAYRRWSGELRLHAGVSRRDDPFQKQSENVLRPSGAVDSVPFLDRQRVVGSARLAWYFDEDFIPWKALVYSEAHSLSAGERREGLASESLPADSGYVVGAQLGAWGFGESAFANVFARLATGLCAYGESAVPRGLALDRTTTGARDLSLALSANYEWWFLGVVAGGYVRSFADADPNVFDDDDFGEGVLALRPTLFLTETLHAALEVSFQARRPHGLDAETLHARTATVWKATALALVSPAGRGTYTRPQIRLYYTLSLPDDAARRLLWNAEDPRRPHKVHHWLGASVEWWFNASYGP